jgi:hypothetical protein
VIGLRVYRWMPVVTSARVGWFVGTGVAARAKLRTPAVTNAKPMRSMDPAIMALVQCARPILEIGKRSGTR